MSDHVYIRPLDVDACTQFQQSCQGRPGAHLVPLGLWIRYAAICRDWDEISARVEIAFAEAKNKAESH